MGAADTGEAAGVSDGFRGEVVMHYRLSHATQKIVRLLVHALSGRNSFNDSLRIAFDDFKQDFCCSSWCA